LYSVFAIDPEATISDVEGIVDLIRSKQVRLLFRISANTHRLQALMSRWKDIDAVFFVEVAKANGEIFDIFIKIRDALAALPGSLLLCLADFNFFVFLVGPPS
jgi:hypothetical protein